MVNMIKFETRLCITGGFAGGALSYYACCPE